MQISGKTRVFIQQTLASIQHELIDIQQTLDAAPSDTGWNPYYTVNEYLLLHRLNNLVTLAGHAKEFVGK